MVKLLGPKPRVVLDRCMNAVTCKQTLEQVKAEVMHAKPDEIQMAAETLTLEKTTQLPSSLFIMRPNSGMWQSRR